MCCSSVTPVSPFRHAGGPACALEEEVQMFQRVLAASAVAILLVCAPVGLSAQEKEARGAEQASVLGWFAGAWGDLAAWLAGIVPAPPAGTKGASSDGSCYVDPNGCPHSG
jgi:hypothetical protein